jgi:hypothetical protein
VVHGPLNLRKINGPVLLQALHFGPKFTAKRVKDGDESKIQWQSKFPASKTKNVSVGPGSLL